MQLCVIGTGFVGVVSAAVFAQLGNQVIGLDIDEKKVALLRDGKVPFFEPGLSELLVEGQRAGRLSFTTDYQAAVSSAQVVMVAVGTPSGDDGAVNLTYLRQAVASLAPHLAAHAVVVIKSTVPPGIFAELRALISEHTRQPFSLASVPEFLKEGTAVANTQHPDRIVIGSDDEHSRDVLSELHRPLGAPMIFTTAESAQLGKYAANAYLATRIAFINQIADVCELTGADVNDVIAVMGADKRIGTHYWYPGLGYGGSCFPKDVGQLASFSLKSGLGETLFVKLQEINHARIGKLLDTWSNAIGGWSGKKVAILGLSFKPQTNDLRDAPSTYVIPTLVRAGATMTGWDPQANAEAQRFFTQYPQFQIADTIDSAVAGVDVVLALVEWPEIVHHDFGSALLNGQQICTFIDVRNQFSPAQIKEWGFQYIGIGRGARA